MMFNVLIRIAWESWLVLGQMGPYLLFGFLMAGLLSVWISPALVERHLGGRGWRPVLKAAALGVPLPLCSCSVIPVAASIRRHGATRGATTAFLLSTPQTGVDSIAITYALLGPIFTLVRPVAALVTGMLGGYLVQFFGESEADDPAGAAATQANAKACTEACCSDRTTRGSWRRGIEYGLVTLPRDIGLALLVGVLIAGAIGALVPEDWARAYLGGGVVSILVMMAVGVPIYVCATASVPIAVGFIHVGVSPGAALAFLIAGPATNAATIATVWKTLGRRTAGLYLATVAVSAVSCGLLLDAMGPAVAASIPHMGGHVHEHAAAGWPIHAGAVLLLTVMAISYAVSAWHASGPPNGNLFRSNTPSPPTPLPQAGEGSCSCTAPRNGVSPMKETVDEGAADDRRIELNVGGMTCGHCANAVQRALAECPGVRSAVVDLKRRLAVVVGRSIDVEHLLAAVTELGYTAELSASDLHRPPEGTRPTIP